MDFTEELRNIKDNKSTFKDLYTDLKNKEQEIKIKIHVAKVLDFVEKFTSLLPPFVTEKGNFGEIDIFCSEDYPVSYIIYEKNRTGFAKQENTEPGLNDKVKETLNTIGSMNRNYVSKEVKEDNKVTVIFDDNFKESLISAFLREDIKKMLDYSIMNLELNDSNNEQIKKHKL